QFALNSSAFGNVVSNLWLAGPVSGEPYLNVGNGGPMRIDGKAAESGGTKLDLAGNWGPRAPTGSTNDWIGHGVNTWDYYEFKHDGTRTSWIRRSTTPPSPSRCPRWAWIGFLPSWIGCSPVSGHPDLRAMLSIGASSGACATRPARRGSPPMAPGRI